MWSCTSFSCFEAFGAHKPAKFPGIQPLLYGLRSDLGRQSATIQTFLMQERNGSILGRLGLPHLHRHPIETSSPVSSLRMNLGHNASTCQASSVFDLRNGTARKLPKSRNISVHPRLSIATLIDRAVYSISHVTAVPAKSKTMQHGATSRLGKDGLMIPRRSMASTPVCQNSIEDPGGFGLIRLSQLGPCWYSL